jgi:hypothetical protein
MRSLVESYHNDEINQEWFEKYHDVSVAGRQKV